MYIYTNTSADHSAVSVQWLHQTRTGVGHMPPSCGHSVSLAVPERHVEYGRSIFSSIYIHHINTADYCQGLSSQIMLYTCTMTVVVKYPLSKFSFHFVSSLPLFLFSTSAWSLGIKLSLYASVMPGFIFWLPSVSYWWLMGTVITSGKNAPQLCGSLTATLLPVLGQNHVRQIDYTS